MFMSLFGCLLSFRTNLTLYSRFVIVDQRGKRARETKYTKPQVWHVLFGKKASDVYLGNILQIQNRRGKLGMKTSFVSQIRIQTKYTRRAATTNERRIQRARATRSSEPFVRSDCQILKNKKKQWGVWRRRVTEEGEWSGLRLASVAKTGTFVRFQSSQE